MSAQEQAKDTIARQLREAVDRLHNDIDRVEFWADALDRLAQPIPDYPASEQLTRHLLPGHRRLAEFTSSEDPAGDLSGRRNEH
jgi:hypothetical protein